MNHFLFLLIVLISGCDLFENEQYAVPGCRFVLDLADSMPVLLGGIGAIRDNLGYPNQAIQDSVEGRVIVDFVVNEDGIPINMEARTNLGFGLEQEAIRVVGNTSYRIPVNNKKPVGVNYSLPVVFSLD